ncbi:hypothetical protein N7E02_09530 [Aliirhizobium terrae]|uniref:hypothetical protein n=1 Tax=Terrirhizobium terrae TaxID=2926709 RepID=UPI002578CA5C|nr:hypothetical protein [Rhizobium sp. CC-CFT758]WJH40800.1 hypothetical protein N7E02_09530 [Rhizobium sp. CC-CFT758]
MAHVHRLISVSIAVAVPAAVFLASGTAAIEFIVLGATMGFACWYWGPTGTLL